MNTKQMELKAKRISAGRIAVKFFDSTEATLERALREVKSERVGFLNSEDAKHIEYLANTLSQVRFDFGMAIRYASNVRVAQQVEFEFNNPEEDD